MELPLLGVGENSTSRTQAFASVLIIDVKSASDLKNKALMGKSSPHVRITVTGATPQCAMTKEVQSNLNPEFNETLVFLLVPGMDVFGIQVMCPGKLTGYDEMGSAAVQCKTVFEQKSFDLKLQPQGTISLGFQLLPLAETMWMPSALQAKGNQLDLSSQRCTALEKALEVQTNEATAAKERCSALETALEAGAEEAEAAKAKAKELKQSMESQAKENEATMTAAKKEADELRTSMTDAEQKLEFLESQTASAKAQAALDGATGMAKEYVENSKKLMADCASQAGQALSSIKAGLVGAISQDKQIQNEEKKDEKDKSVQDKEDKKADKTETR